MRKYRAAESVTKGHPDKLCDRIADEILDAYLARDPDARVAIEVLATRHLVVIAGEVTSKARVDARSIAKHVLDETGYNSETFFIDVRLHRQSEDIAMGVDGNRAHDRIWLGAGDQGIVYGYATNETSECLPLAHVLARNLTRRLEAIRENEIVPGLLPDGKSLVVVEYVDGVAIRIHAVVLSAQHESTIDVEVLRDKLRKNVIEPVLEGGLPFEEAEVLINPTGRFVTGGLEADTGLTGRKNAVDSYGGLALHGGGAFSGKDPTKVDRSAAYMARLVAKSVIKSGFATECEVSIAYAIGMPEPLFWDLDCFGTEKLPLDDIKSKVETLFPFSVLPMIQFLRLTEGGYARLASEGHFGHKGDPWESISAGDLLQYGGCNA